MPRTAFYVCFAVFFTGLLAVSLSANAQEVVDQAVEMDVSPVKSYTVENIEVDVSAENAVKAREKAFEEAQIKGYQMLAERFLTAEELKSFKVPDINTVSSLVKDYEVMNEKLSATRYNGVYKIRYSNRAFQKSSPLDKTQEVTVGQIGDLLVLPFYQVSGNTFLWQVNPFLDAWARARNEGRSGRAIVPIGDINDVSGVRDNQGLNYDPSALNAMRLRYKAKDVALMIAKPSALPDGSINIQVELYKVKPYGPELVRQISVRGYRGEVEDQRYNRVVTEVQKALGAGHVIQNQPLVETLTMPTGQPLSGPTNNLIAKLNFNSVREWVEAKKSVERAYGVSSVQVKSLSPRNAVVEISYQGGVDNLRNALQQSGVRLDNPQGDLAAPVAVYQLTLFPSISRY